MAPDAMRERMASLQMNESAVVLNTRQREVAQFVIAEHCQIRGWLLHAEICRTNHVHVVVTAADAPIARPREQFKAWTTRKLKAEFPSRAVWWTERGWDVYLDNQRELESAVAYVLEGQD